MKVFHHGGRIGDCIYALYTIKSLGGGRLILSKFHVGSWGDSEIDSLSPLVEYQDYIESVRVADICNEDLDLWRLSQIKPKIIDDEVDYDLHDCELDYNPDMFPEWHGKSWPGNCHIGKRYSIHYGIRFNHSEPWIRAPRTMSHDVVVHLPFRRMVRSASCWLEILNSISDQGFSVKLIGSQYDTSMWDKSSCRFDVATPRDMLHASDYINSSRLFVGVASSNYVIAESIMKDGFVELSDDSSNAKPMNDRMAEITGFDNNTVVKMVVERLNNGE